MKVSVECVAVCLKVWYGWGFFGFDIGDFWDCFYWSRSGMDRGVCRRAVPNDFWWFLEWEIWWWDFWWFECWFGFLDVWVEWNYYRLSEQSNCNFKCKHTPLYWLPILCRFSPKHNIDRNILETFLLTFLNEFSELFFSNISWSCYKLLFFCMPNWYRYRLRLHIK